MLATLQKYVQNNHVNQTQSTEALGLCFCNIMSRTQRLAYLIVAYVVGLWVFWKRSMDSLIWTVQKVQAYIFVAVQLDLGYGSIGPTLLTHRPTVDDESLPYRRLVSTPMRLVYLFHSEVLPSSTFQMRAYFASDIHITRDKCKTRCGVSFKQSERSEPKHSFICRASVGTTSVDMAPQ